MRVPHFLLLAQFLATSQARGISQPQGRYGSW